MILPKSERKRILDIVRRAAEYGLDDEKVAVFIEEQERRIAELEEIVRKAK